MIWNRSQDHENWDQQIGLMEGTHPLQSSVWGKFKSRWGWHATYWEAEKGTVRAVVLQRKIPYTPFSILYIPKGPLAQYDNEQIRAQLLPGLEKLGRDMGGILIKIDPELPISWGIDEEEMLNPVAEAFQKELTSRGWVYSQEQVQFPNTVLLDLAKSEEDLLAVMKSKTRYNIRLAERKEVVIREGAEADLSLLFGMYQETASRDQFSIRPDAYYEDIWRSWFEQGMGKLFVAEYNGMSLGGVYLVAFGDRVIYMYGASTNEERNRMPNYLLQWEAIRWAKKEGYRWYDFWGAPTDFVEEDPLWGVWRFKQGFNGIFIRHLGAWDYPIRPFWYKLYTVVLPKYIAMLRRKK